MTEVIVRFVIPEGFGPAGIQYLVNKALKGLDVPAEMQAVFDGAADFPNLREAFLAAYQREMISGMSGGAKR